MQRTAVSSTLPLLDIPDNLACATQLEAAIALFEWQRQRHLPPEQRVVGVDHAALRYEATLDLLRRELAA